MGSRSLNDGWEAEPWLTFGLNGKQEGILVLNVLCIIGLWHCCMMTMDNLVLIQPLLYFSWIFRICWTSWTDNSCVCVLELTACPDIHMVVQCLEVQVLINGLSQRRSQRLQRIQAFSVDWIEFGGLMVCWFGWDFSQSSLAKLIVTCLYFVSLQNKATTKNQTCLFDKEYIYPSIHQRSMLSVVVHSEVCRLIYES